LKRLDAYWYSNNAVAQWLRPIAFVYCCLVVVRRTLYKLRLLSVYRPPVPVIVVGNMTVGGTGKTPLVIWLVKQLLKEGYSPGVVSRGYGGQARSWPQQVRPDSDPRTVGDEAVIIARQLAVPMAVGPKRAHAARALLEKSQIDVLVSDDGMQHYALGRDIEIAVVDGVRRFGNKHCLPAGPLREPLWRLGAADHIVVKGLAGQGEVAMSYTQGRITNLQDSSKTITWEELQRTPVHLVAGIGHPKHFFEQVSQKGIESIEHSFDDHHSFESEDLNFGDEYPVLMTEKDAIKCRAFASENLWYLPIEADVDEKLAVAVLKQIKERKRG